MTTRTPRDYALDCVARGRCSCGPDMDRRRSCSLSQEDAMTDKYEALRKAAQKASPGPWRAAAFHPQILDGRSGSSQTLVCTVAVNTFNDEGRHNEALIAAANPAAILELLAERDKLRDALDIIYTRSFARDEEMGVEAMRKIAREALNQEGRK